MVIQSIGKYRRLFIAAVFAISVVALIATDAPPNRSEAAERTANAVPRPQIPNYDIRADRSETAREYLAAARRNAGRNAADIAALSYRMAGGGTRLRARVPQASIEYGSAVWRLTDFISEPARFLILQSSNAQSRVQQWGRAGDAPEPADYDGDGKSDIAIYRPSVAEWWIQRSTAGLTAFQFGAGGDKTVPGDFTGDGKVDAAFWRPATGQWFILRSEDFSFFAFPFGTNGDVPAPGDYDGDGKFDAAIFRPSNSTWFVQRSTAGTMIQQFGQAGDLPVPNAFVR